MDPQRFDAMTRRLGAAPSRRQVLSALVASTLGAVQNGSVIDEVAAACRGYNAKCKKSANCCAGSGLTCVKRRKHGKHHKHRKGRCRCQKGWQHCPGTGVDCLNVQTDADNCGACGHQCPPQTPCCFGGECQATCGDGMGGETCCPDCFVEIFSNGTPDLDHPVCCLASGGTICGPNKKKTSDDRCCYPDQECVKGTCCCDGCQGSVICGGTCCSQAACCDGECCGQGKVCASTPNGDACVSPTRQCDAPGDCFSGEVCHGGVCCSGQRICNDGTNDFCCARDEYCEFPGVPIANCCPINTICNSTYRGHRVRR